MKVSGWVRDMKQKLKNSHGAALMVVFGMLLLSGCSEQHVSFLDPQGPIAAAQKAHMLKVVAWTMIAIIPVFILVPLMLWRYRYRNDKARYTPDWEFSGWLDAVMWGVPLIIITVLSTQLWHSTHALDPYKPIASDQAPVNVQVVGLDWKWLFIYPDHGIATVNELAFPAGASVSLELTTDTVMQSLLISALAGQIYTMPGMRTKLHLLADNPGRFEGENTQFTGAGFTEQKFEAVAMTTDEFGDWIETVKRDGVPLDKATYGQLAVASTGREAYTALGKPKMPDGILYFNRVEPALFESILHRYMRGSPVPPAEQPGAVGYAPPTLPAGASQ
jgi:cytochrome o ubiquinol oxidase subunit 2